MENQMNQAEKSSEEKPAAPPTKVRMVFSIIVLVIGLILLANGQQGWGWFVTLIGVAAIVYNAVMLRKGK